jgi:hydroxymethylpyrimidine kinase/phosphomethylpyrimidine kinase/thiamine-phosphate diphosphorylase
MRGVLTIAGSDSSGGAGIQADLRAIAAASADGLCAVTAVTAQTRTSFLGAMPVSPPLLRAQIDAAFDSGVAAVKTGMLATRALVDVVTAALCTHHPAHVVVDPVLVSTSGAPLLDPDAVEAVRRWLVPLASLVTPNVDEALALTGIAVNSIDDAERAGRALVEMGARAALVKGGHLHAAPATDVLVTRGGRVEVLAGRHVDGPNMRGTGCALSAAIAAHLAGGAALSSAVRLAKAYVEGAIRRSARASVGRLHVLTDEVLQSRFSHVELARLAAVGGADVVQYRDKRPMTTRERVVIATEIRRAIESTRAILVVDDHVDVAVAASAQAVHLGRDDLHPSHARRLLGPHVLVGGTANDLAEARSVAETPIDYLGVGPVFGTRSKSRPAAALGLERLAEIVRAVDKPVIAIGSINRERVASVLATGAHGVAVLSDVVTAEDPSAATRALRRAIEREVSRV